MGTLHKIGEIVEIKDGWLYCVKHDEAGWQEKDFKIYGPCKFRIEPLLESDDIFSWTD
jgi:hypothetical protein